MEPPLAKAGVAGDSRLGPGSVLGHFRIERLLGRGGMGEVFLARDLRLDRAVAIKLLSAELGASPERLARLRREALAAAALNHPNICAIHEVGEGEQPYLVLEYVEGRTLSELCADGPLSIDQVVRFGSQIAEALDEAHRAGIVHRDIKSANVLVTVRSQVKVLDFGLAKRVDPAEATVAFGDATQSAQTQAGTLLGTLAYMSPEQALGRALDARTDLFSLGVVLYELLSGKRPFLGNPQEILAAVVHEAPLPICQVRPGMPAELERIVGKLLEKSPDARYQSAHEVMTDLRQLERRIAGLASEPRSTASKERADLAPGVPSPNRRSRTRHWAWIWLAPIVLAALYLVARAAGFAPPLSSRTLPVTRTEVRPPVGTLFGSFFPFALSPDGRYLAYTGVDEQSRTPRLWIHAFESGAARVVAGSEDGTFPFWSPDSRQVAYSARGELRAAPAEGGTGRVLCRAGNLVGGSWGDDGTILFADGWGQTLRAVSASGGEPRAEGELEAKRGEQGRVWPQFLPASRSYLFWSYLERGAGVISIAELGSERVDPLLESSFRPWYASGHLLFWRDSTLLAQRLSITKRRFEGDALPVADGVFANAAANFGSFSASENGVLAFLPSVAVENELVWVDRGGRKIGVAGKAGQVHQVDLSRDEQSLALSGVDERTRQGEISILGVESASSSRFTFHPAYDYYAVWSPDGQTIAFSTDREGCCELWIKPASGAEDELPLVRSGTQKAPTSFSPDGRLLVYQEFSAKTGWDLRARKLDSDETIELVASPARESSGQVSPDGRWLAYVSDESGQPEVYVAPFPGGGGRWQVSRDGGQDPRWRGDGKEIYFLGAGRMFAATVTASEAARFGDPTPLFEMPLLAGYWTAPEHSYVVSADGEKFLLITPSARARETALTIVTNWPESMARN